MGMQLIETITVGSGGVANVTFSDIPQDGIDLICLVSGRRSTAAEIGLVAFRYNGITTSTYTRLYLEGDGSSAYSSSTTTTYWGAQSNADTSTANTFGNFELRISNYTLSQAKTASLDAVSENNATAARASINALSETGTDPVTSLFVSMSNFLEHSTISLYKTIAD